MAYSILRRLVCAVKVLILTSLAAIVFVGVLGILSQPRLALPGVVRSQAFFILGCISIPVLAYCLLEFISSVTRALATAWQAAPSPLRRSFLYTMGLWLVIIAILPVAEVWSSYGEGRAPNILLACFYACILFVVPPVITLLIWLAVDGRPSITILDRIKGSIGAGIIPGFAGLMAIVANRGNNALVITVTIVGLAQIPFLLAFIFPYGKQDTSTESPTT